MGTNYYLEENVCGCCKNPERTLHIGKSSGGWCFALQVLPEYNLTSLDAWKERMQRPESIIRDEYGTPVTFSEMLHTITDRSWTPQKEVSPEFYRTNHAEPGPNGLVRHAISKDSRCVGHGEGTWDLIEGEFS
jgi:hypothetical protein